MSALLEYECRVPVGGHDVITIEREYLPGGSRSKWITEEIRILHPRSKRMRRFDLFEFSSSAFLEFAQTPLTEDGIKDFADRYGPLGGRPRRTDYYPRSFVQSLEEGRVIYEWVENIQWMHRAVELWRKSTVTGDFNRLIREAGEHLEIGGGLLLEKNPLKAGVPVGLLLKKDPLSASPKLCIRPGSLWQALWAQLVLAIDGNLNLRACVQCRKWFTLEAGKGRSDKEYCSDACRMRAYRKRKGSG
jgi:hypothetical protein